MQQLNGLAFDGQHYTICVISKAFELLVYYLAGALIEAMTLV